MTVQPTHIRGLETVVRNLNIQLEGITNRSMKGLIMAAAHIRNQTEKTPPVTPVDLGNLRSSYFVATPTSVVVGRSGHQFKGDRAAKLSSDHSSTISEAQSTVAVMSTGRRKFLMLGYTVDYALWVHEMIGMNPQEGHRYGPGPGKKRKYKPRSGSGPKWLESAIKNNQAKIVQIVATNTRIK